MNWFNKRNDSELPTQAQLHAEFEKMLSEAIAFGRHKAKIRLPAIANRLQEAANMLRGQHAMTAPVDSALF